MKYLTLIAASMMACSSAAALANQQASAEAAAPATPSLSAGAMVYDGAGDEVGTILSAEGGTVVLDTGTNRASLAAASFGVGPKGPVIGMTKLQLNTAIENAAAQTAAALDAALVVGAPVLSQDGQSVGTVKEIKEGIVVLDRPSGAVALPRANFTASSAGLALRMSAQQLEDAIAQTAAPSPAAE